MCSAESVMSLVCLQFCVNVYGAYHYIFRMILDLRFFLFLKDKEPVQEYYDGFGYLQCVLHVTVAVRTVCFTYPGELRKGGHN